MFSRGKGTVYKMPNPSSYNGQETNIKRRTFLDPNGKLIELFRADTTPVTRPKKRSVRKLVTDFLKKCNLETLKPPSEIPDEYWKYRYKLDNDPGDNKESLCRKENKSLEKIKHFIDTTNKLDIASTFRDLKTNNEQRQFDPINKTINKYDRSIWRITYTPKNDDDDINNSSEKLYFTPSEGSRGGKYNKTKSKGKKQYPLRKRKFTVKYKQR